MRADAAQDAEHRLHEQRRLHQPALQEMGEIIEVTDVVALELEARVVVLAGLQDELDILERVAEDEIARALEIGLFPVVLELLVAVEHGIEREIDRPHVEAGDLGLEMGGRHHAFFHPHGRRAARGQVDDRVGALLDARQEAPEGLRRLVRPAGLGIARMQVDNRGARLGGADRRVRDLFRGDRQMRRHARRVDRARDRAGDDDLVFCHVVSVPLGIPCCDGGILRGRAGEDYPGRACRPPGDAAGKG